MGAGRASQFQGTDHQEGYWYRNTAGERRPYFLLLPGLSSEPTFERPCPPLLPLSLRPPPHPHLPSTSQVRENLRALGSLPSAAHRSGFVSSASPVPQIKWRKVDGSLSPQWATAEPTLQIPSVTFEDEGTYECEAENSKGRDTVQGRIIVQGTQPGHPLPLPSLLLP